MKNCLVVLVILIGCFVAAAYLALYQPIGQIRGPSRTANYAIATWTDFDDDDLSGLKVNILTNEIDIDVPQPGVARRISEKGHWNMHAFFCDSHVDSPPEVEVARELQNEDLEVDIGRFLPNHPRKIVCVKTFRIFDPDPDRYPTNNSGITPTYPPPKGLICPGMLECDLQLLPWNAEDIEVSSGPVEVNVNQLSDGSVTPGYFSPFANGTRPDSKTVYTYRSDRKDATKLLVTVYHGRVTGVTGGAEETSDIPYQLRRRPRRRMHRLCRRKKGPGPAGCSIRS